MPFVGVFAASAPSEADRAGVLAALKAEDEAQAKKVGIWALAR